MNKLLAEKAGVLFPAGVTNYLSPQNIQIISGTHPASYPISIYRVFFSQGIEQQGRETEDALPSIAQVNNEYGDEKSEGCLTVHLPHEII